MKNDIVLKVSGVNKRYGNKGSLLNVINGVSLSIKRGEFCAIMGPSGSGKTTLLNLLAGIDDVDEGTIIINEEDVTKLCRNDMALFRRDHIGIVYQDFNLIDSLNVKENIVLPMHLEELTVDEADVSVNGIATMLGIRKLLDKPVYEISGGEQQRVAICRAIINNPDILLADEPTGNLDSKSAHIVMNCFAELNQKNNSTIIMVTHDVTSASYCKKVLFFKDGSVIREINNTATRGSFYKQILAELDKYGG